MRGVWAIVAWCERQPAESHVDRLLRLLVSAVVLVFPAACLLVDRSDSLSLFLLAITGLLVWVRSGFKSGLTRRDWLFVAVFAGFFLAAVLGFELGHQTDAGFRLMGRYLRLLFVLPVLLALRRYRPPATVVWAALALGTLVLGLDAAWESVAAGGFLRPDGDTNVAILFGDLATLTTFAFAAGYIYIDERLPRTGPWLVVGCVLLGLLASFLSGTRGAWIAIPVLLLLFLSCRHLLRPQTVLVGTATVATLFTLLAFLPQTHILDRIDGAVSQIRAYSVVNLDADRSDAPPQCFDNPEALHAWISAATGQYPEGFSVGISQLRGLDAKELSGYGCSHGAAVYLNNRGKGVAWIQLQRYTPSDTGLTATHILVKGTGHAGFSQDKDSQQFIDTRLFALMTLTAPARYGGAIDFVMLPGDGLWFAPKESYFGEYQYALTESPVGQRLEMWWAGWRLFREAPLFGVGTGAYQAETRKLVASGEAAPDAADFDHPHSDYFDALSSRGLVGLLALLSLLGVPAWMYARGIGSRDPHRMGAALGGLLVTVGFAIFGLTETMLIHSVTIGWYVIMTSVFLVSADGPEGQGTGK